MPDPSDDDYIVPPGFDLYGDWGQDASPLVDDLADQFGWADWRDVIVAEGFYDETNVRPGVYHTAEDAIQEAYEMGILSFSHIIYDPLEDEWHLVVDDDSGGG
jgi:hypothetical protein